MGARRLVGAHARFAPNRVYVSASLVKAMLLVAYLRGIGNRAPDAGERALLGPMITVSSNDAADTVYYRVGDAALYRLARRAGMRHFSVAGYWGTPTSARRTRRASSTGSTGWCRRPRARYARAAPLLDRGLPALGLLALLARRPASGPSSRAAGAGPAPGSSCTRRRCSSAGGTRFSMAVLTDGEPVARVRHRDAARGGAADLPPGPCGAGAPEHDAPNEAGTPATRRAGLVDVHRSRPASGWTCPTATKHNHTGAPLPGYCENWALTARAGRLQPRPGAAPPAPRGPRPPDPRCLPAGARHGGARPLGASGRAAAALVGTLHRAPQPPQHRQRGGHHAGPPPRRQAPAHGPASTISARSSHTYNASGRVLRNRLMLKSAMERFGFSAYLARVVALRAPRASAEPLTCDVTLGC